MPDFSRSITIDATPDELFEFLSKIENLPTYFARLTEAHHTQGDEVSVTAVLEPEDTGGERREVQGEAWFSIDADARSLSWGSEGENDYRGELSVSPDGDGATVAVTLHTQHDDESVYDGIDDTLANITEQVASRPPLRN